MAFTRLRGSLLLAGSLLALTACGNGFQNGVSATTTTAPSTTTGESGPTTADRTTADRTTAESTTADRTTADRTDPGGRVPAGYPERPGRDQCVVVPEAPDGTYPVYEAGTAVVTRDGDRLVLGEITAADGWTSRVDDQEDDEIEIDFRAGGSDILDLEVEIDDGRLEVQICADDD